MADDFADEGPERTQLELAGQGATPKGPMSDVFDPLARAIRNFDLPLSLLVDLLDAFEQDVIHTRDQIHYSDHDALMAYCAKSANPVGRLLLHLYGIQSQAQLRQSDCICSALQLINFWQDLSVDLPRGRHYLPSDAVRRHGLDRANLVVNKDTKASRALVRELTEQARALMLEGAALAKAIPGRAGWELRMVVQGGLRILDRIQMVGYGTLSKRPTLKRTDILVMLWRSLRM
jgi:hydroxysqualene synthase